MLKRFIRNMVVGMGVYVVIYVAIFAGYGSCRYADVAGVCDEHGYPEHKMTVEPAGLWGFLPGDWKGYCFKRVDGTDVSVSVDTLEEP